MKLAIAILVLAATIARADEAGDRREAETHFRAGQKAYAAQMFESAALNFDEAYKKLDLPEIAFSAAQAYRRQYRIDPKIDYAKRSVELYRAYLDKVKTGGRVGVAADGLGEMQRELDKLTAAGMKMAAATRKTQIFISPAFGVEKLEMREIADLPESTKVKMVATIDGKPVEPLQYIDVEAGNHKVRVEAEGYEPAEKLQPVAEGTSPVAELQLSPKPAKLSIKTERGARVKIDGRPIGTTPLAVFDVPAGKHLLTITRTGREPVAQEIEASRGQAIVVTEKLRSTGRRRAVPFVAGASAVLGAVTLGGVIYGIKLNADASSILDRIEKGDQPPGTIDRYHDKTDRRGQVLTGSLITGSAAVAIGAIAGVMYWLDRPSEEGLRVTPAITSGGVAVTLGRQF